MSAETDAMAIRQKASQSAKAAEIRRLERVMARGFVPDDCGPVPVAPARGPIRVAEMRALYPKGENGYETKPAGFLGRRTVKILDAFDVMAAQSKGGRKGPGFTATQVAMDRHYRGLTERFETAGIRCSSLETTGGSGGGSGGSGGSGSFNEAVLDHGRKLDLLHTRIGPGNAMAVRRAGRRKRRAITDRRLVDAVCLEDQTLSAVLDAHGWAVGGEAVKSLASALSEILDRMMGPVRNPGIAANHFGNQTPKMFGG